MNDGQKLRVALVGCGRVADKHLAAIESLKASVELVGVCDSDSDVVAAASRASGAPGYTSLSELLAQPCRPELVALATPSALHAEQAIEAARAGCHVMTEKPMATRWADALKMVQCCEDAGVELFVIKQIRYNPILQLLKRSLDARRFGRIYMVDVNVFWTRPQEYYDSAAWRGTWAHDGGALMNQASHYIDLLTWLIGPVESVHAFGSTLARNIEVEDTAVMNLRWRVGALGTMSVTMLTYPRNFETTLTILGERATIKLGGPACNRVEHWEFDADHPDDDALEQAAEQALASLRAGHTLFYRDAIEVLRHGGSPRTDGREGLKSLELIVAAYRSIQEDRRIAIPFEF
ncbi:MAG: Gfo/Idh/MocA family oxidoreductase [Bradymonadaceae bacterium]|nr:Gfo/Idh/MocA family oxidoreductase [Lujinxingiaceae bacterium]